EMQLGDLEMREKRYPEAEKHLLSAADKAQGTEPGAQRLLYDMLFQCMAQQQKVSEATRYVEKLASLDADGVGGQGYRARLAMLKGDTDTAVRISGDLANQ